VGNIKTGVNEVIFSTGYRAKLMAASVLAIAGMHGTGALAQDKADSVSTSKEAIITPMAGQVDPDWGNIRTFWGNIRTFEDGSTGEPISPYWGNIRTFWGEISPFEGDIEAFWGNIRTFNEGDPNSVTPEWGNIRTFWGDLGGQWGNIRTFWGNIRTFEDREQLAGQLSDVISQSEGFWGDAVKAETGKDFRSGFANPILAKHGIDLNDPNSLTLLDVAQQEQFFMEWYDGLMAFSGADHVDHWMNQIHWNPALTTTIGEGRDSTIGLIDFTVTGKDTGRLSYDDGISTFTNGHGAAVASLMVAAHDGKGIMGLAPMSNVVAYNPFDATGTASFADVRTGILELSGRNASIINMSLGVSGWTLNPEWGRILNDPEVMAATKNSIFVLAAGNDGITQTENVKWDFDMDPNLIIVGSVDPKNQISSFSNRPGEACLVKKDKCDKGSMDLMHRFIVAPGELILVSDGNGGVYRKSGTSFAAPLVSGTVALLHDRWPWLSQHPKESVDIILDSAQDLGEKGTDDIYGVGLLDVTAALSPLDFGKVEYYEFDSKGNLKEEQQKKIRSKKEQKKWESEGMFFFAFEDVGETFRDFAIPLSSQLVDQSVLTKGGSQENFQAYLYNAFMDWATSKGKFADTGHKSGFAGYNQLASINNAVTSGLPGSEGYNIALTMTPRRYQAFGNNNNVPYETAVSFSDTDGQTALMFGEGSGAIQLGMVQGINRTEDYDPYTGGANPYLGFASGGAFGQFSYALNDKTRVSVGVTEKSVNYVKNGASGFEREELAGLKALRNNAATIAINYQLNDKIEVVGSYTRLNEDSSLLGVQSLNPSDFASGSASDGLTMGASVDMGESIHLSASGTIGRSHSDSGNIRATDGGLTSTAFQVAMNKNHVIDKKDHMRVSVSQPLYLESGTLEYDVVKVVDRQTGEIGRKTQRFQLQAGKRPLVAEFSYGRSMMNDSASFNLFGRAQVQGDPQGANIAGLVAGAGFRLRF